jgi:hypothetical protein
LRNDAWVAFAFVVAFAFCAAACGGGDEKGTGGGGKDAGTPEAGTADAGAVDAGAVDAGGPAIGIETAKPAAEVASASFARPVDTVLQAGKFGFLVHPNKDLTIQDLSDPRNPRTLGVVATAGKVVAAEYEETGRVLFVADAGGVLYAYGIIAPDRPAKIAEVTLPGTSGKVTGIARIGGTVFVLAGASLTPVTVAGAALTARSPITLASAPSAIASGGGNIVLGYKAGKIETWRAAAGAAPAKAGESTLNGELQGLIVRGSKTIGFANGKGMSVIDFSTPASPKVVYEDKELHDAYDVRLFGRTLVVGLSRGYVSAIDISDFSRPRALTTNKGKAPKWVAAVDGNLFFGDANGGSVAGVPPVVAGRIPEVTRKSFPRYGTVSLTLSKAADPATVSAGTVALSCEGAAVSGTVTTSPDRLRLTFVPAATLPAQKTCTLALSGVKDVLGLPIEGGTDNTFQTSGEAPAPVVNPKSAYPHTVDGAFTDWDEGKDKFEWFDVKAAPGMYTYFYADFDGEYLWMLNDWFYNGEDIDPDCYNQFNAWTANGAEQWEVRAYGDQHVEVKKNGEPVDTKDGKVKGGFTYAASPNRKDPHTIYEIRVPAGEGQWGVQLHDPGPTFGCKTIESESTGMQGQSGGGSTTVDPTQKPAAPAKPSIGAPANGARDVALTPVLAWQTTDTWTSFVGFWLWIGTSANMSSAVYAAPAGAVNASGNSFAVPAGLLAPGTTYYWSVSAVNMMGQTPGDVFSFTTAAGVETDGGFDGGGGDGGESCAQAQTCGADPSKTYQACCTTTSCRFALSDGGSIDCGGTDCTGAPIEQLMAWCAGGTDGGSDAGVDAAVDAGEDGGLPGDGITCTAGPERVCTDSVTHLEWQDPQPPELQMFGGASYCNSLTWAGLSDWRLPTISELRSLVRSCPANQSGGVCGVTDLCNQEQCSQTCQSCGWKGGPGANGCYISPSMGCENGCVSSSTLVSDIADTRWCLDFSDASIGRMGIYQNALARCVRSAGADLDGGADGGAIDGGADAGEDGGMIVCGGSGEACCAQSPLCENGLTCNAATKMCDNTCTSTNPIAPLPAEGCVNITPTATAFAASTTYAEDFPANAADENRCTNWNATDRPPQWWQADFGQTRFIRGVTLVAAVGPSPADKEFIIETSLDGSSYTTQLSLSQSLTDKADYPLVFNEEVEARYVRISSTTSISWDAWYEVAVWSCPCGGEGQYCCAQAPECQVAMPCVGGVCLTCVSSGNPPATGGCPTCCVVCAAGPMCADECASYGQSCQGGIPCCDGLYCAGQWGCNY